MYSVETIQKFVRTMKDQINVYNTIDVHELNVSISKGNSKIGHVLNVSIPAIISCANCAECSKFCYDVKDCFRQGWNSSTMKARARNWSILQRDRDMYFDAIDDAMSRRRKNKMFRFHVGGEIPDADYLRRMIEIARKHPDFAIWTYTKMYWIVNSYIDENGLDAIPTNLVVMFSEWRGQAMENPYNFPEFRVIFKGEETPADCTWICPGNCDICKAAHRGCIAGETTHAKEH